MRALAGRTAILTGASRGIGPVIAHALAHAGLHLVLAARSAGALEQVRDAIRARGGVAVAVPTDVTADAGRRALVEAATATCGSIDVLVNNAGIEYGVPFHTLTPDEIETMVRTNLTAGMLLTSLVLPGMLARRRGQIVQLASLAGKQGAAHAEVYAATKAGQIAFTQSLRASYRGSGVSASVITPGFVEAGMYTDALMVTGERAPALLGTVPPERVAQAVVQAIRTDAPELIVTARPIRPLLVLAAVAPRLAERSLDLVGVNRLLHRAGRARLEAKAGPRSNARGGS